MERVLEVETPMIGLGTDVKPNDSVQNLLKKAGLDWEVKTEPCYAKIGSDEVPIGKMALVRETDGKILDLISDDWRTMQNRDALEFFKDFADATNLSINSVGSMKDGKIIWALASMNQDFNISRGKDTVKPSIIFTNPHSYGQSIDVRMALIREANNTSLVLPLRTTNRSIIRINHRAEFDPDFVKNTITAANEGIKRYRGFVSVLNKKKYKTDEPAAYLESLFSPSDGDMNRTGKYALEEVLNNGPGSEFGTDTYWALFNSACYVIDHIMGRTQDNRLYSSWYGTGQKMKIKALESALKLAE